MQEAQFVCNVFIGAAVLMYHLSIVISHGYDIFLIE